MKQNVYKVLWVDDDGEIVSPAQFRADQEYDLDLEWRSNWLEAKREIEENFKEYSAIILDANCKINPDDLEDGCFIPVILNELTKIFDLNGSPIPWYIYSAGTMGDFDFVIRAAERTRDAYSEEWGEMWFLKNASIDNPRNIDFLFRQIRKIAGKQSQNSVLFRHGDVFSYIGKGRLIDSESGRVRKTLLEMLDAFYSPEDNRKFRYKGNDLRVIFECIFEPAREYGLLPDDCFEKGRVNIKSARYFMEGKNIDCYKNSKKLYSKRWGRVGQGRDGDGEGCDCIFSPVTSKCIENMLEYATIASHKVVDENDKELYFGYVMHLCQAIREFGEFVDKHPDVEENKKMHRNPNLNYNIENLLNKTYTVAQIERCLVAGEFVVAPEFQKLVKVGDSIKIEEAIENSDESDKFNYPFIATKITLVTEE